MALKPKPITLTSIPTEDYEGAGAPQPFVVVGGVEGTVDPQAAIANQATVGGTFADLAAATTAHNSLVAKVNAILTALRSAGVIAP